MSRSIIFRCLLLAVVILPWSFTKAQIPTRIIVNEGFERPDLNATCGIPGSGFDQIDQSAVQGWLTTAPSQAGLSCGPSSGSPIEIWSDGFLSVPAFEGNQFAEVNAESVARLYQEVCLTANESVNYQYYHRARAQANETTRASLHDAAGALVFSGPLDAVSLGDGWVQHSGALTNDAVAGARQFSFESLSPASPVGNFIDNITVDLRPLLEIQLNTMSPASGSEDSVGSMEFALIISGTLDSDAVFNLTLDAASSASPQLDFSVAVGALAGRGEVNSFNSSNGEIQITLPAGEYDPNQTTNSLNQQGVIVLPLSISADALYEGDETIVYNLGTIQSGGGSTADKNLEFNDSTCNGAIVSQVMGTIVDDEPEPPRQVPTIGIWGQLSLVLSALLIVARRRRSLV
ncbi:MAG: hypothetical protein OIF51_04945 [Cellvibrionaceae bacterium]|nr:hypothetical protein [Cellvibrionaceae bacterium]